MTTPQPLSSLVGQGGLELEVAYCVGGVVGEPCGVPDPVSVVTRPPAPLPAASSAAASASADPRRVGAPAVAARCGRWCRTKPRHTTRLDGLPPTVTVTRSHHPLVGQALEVLGWQRRQGRLQLTLVLPDGSKSLVPAEWTDLEPRAGLKQPQALGSVADLLHARTVLAPLLDRIDASDDARLPSKEVARAAAAVPGPGRHPGTPASGVGRTDRRAAGRRRGAAGPPDRQDALLRGRGGR